jgi:hypothetical protein
MATDKAGGVLVTSGEVVVHPDPGPTTWDGSEDHPGQVDTSQPWPEIPGMPSEDEGKNPREGK